jgi:hypothetical protein
MQPRGLRVAKIGGCCSYRRNRAAIKDFIRPLNPDLIGEVLKWRMDDAFHQRDAT